MVTLTGFTSVATEPADTSQLVDFAGMGYTGGAMADWTAPPSNHVKIEQNIREAKLSW